MDTSVLGTAELNALIQVSKTVNAHLDLDTVLQSVLEVTGTVMKAEASSLVLVDEETSELTFHVAIGKKAGALRTLRLESGQGIVGWVIQNRKPVVVNDVNTDDRFYAKVDEASGFSTKAILCVPVMTTKRLWGAIELLNKTKGHEFDEKDVVLCEAIAVQAAIAIENATLHEWMVKTERFAAIGQTIAGLAHCIKNVLNGLQGGAYMVDFGLRKEHPEKITRGWELVKKNSSFMQDLVLDMLAYAKERKPQLEISDLGEILQLACDMKAEYAAKRNVSIQCENGAGTEAVTLDPREIRRCLLNLVGNAVDACSGQESAQVKVKGSVNNGGSVLITVSDNGTGISDEDKKNLFKMFFSTKGSSGTGLGLAVTRKIVEEHGGSIDVDSEVGSGTTFTIDLPQKGG